MGKKQVKVPMDLGFLATKDRLIESRVMSGDGQDFKGRFDFHLKGFKDVTYQIFSRSQALCITFPEKGVEWKDCFERVKPYLVEADGKPAGIKGTPDFVKLRKSKEKTRFGFFEWLDRRADREERKRDRILRELEAEVAESEEEIEMNEDEFTLKKGREIRLKWRKEYGLDE